ncbi:hypothetical protein C1H46_020635 [Malus baccata]|uniref:Uncharacterized protein n=1 Tax=Malus baccata TaxID=106549 RepID=A0A540M4X1_MALBA|nr:hypothetical protein C1H46_020635 [Malus baccata]
MRFLTHSTLSFSSAGQPTEVFGLGRGDDGLSSNSELVTAEDAELMTGNDSAANTSCNFLRCRWTEKGSPYAAQKRSGVTPQPAHVQSKGERQRLKFALQFLLKCLSDNLVFNFFYYFFICDT